MIQEKENEGRKKKMLKRKKTKMEKENMTTIGIREENE